MIKQKVLFSYSLGYSKSMLNLILGDCLEKLSDLKPDSVDLVLADPPYGVTACEWDSIIDLSTMWSELKRVVRPHTPIVLTSQQPFTTALISSNMKGFKYLWIWDKQWHTNPLSVKHRPLRVHEDILIFGESPVYYPQKTIGKKILKGMETTGEAYGKAKTQPRKWSDTYYPRSILRIPKICHTGSFHPTQKPVRLMEYLINTYSKKGQTVLDFSMGSGSTGVAAKALGRNFIGIEKEEKYFKVAEQRILGAYYSKSPTDLGTSFQHSLPFPV
jgi:site-specific DNA-methyltransferase (adenine-specific)